MGRANLWQLAALVLGPIIIAGAYAKGGQVHWILYLMGALFLGAAVPLAVELWRLTGSQAAPAKAVQAGKELLRYGLPRVPGSVLLAGLFGLGPLLASYFGSPKEAGYLVVGQSVFALSEAGLTAFGLVVLPKAAHLAAAGRLDYLRKRISDVLEFTVHFGVFSVVQVFVWSDQLVRMWLGQQYSEAIPVMRILLLAVVPYFVYVMLRSIIDGLEERAVNTQNLSVAVAVAGVSSLVLGGMGFGSRGLAIGAALGFITLGFATARYLWRGGWLSSKEVQLTGPIVFNVGALGLAVGFKAVTSQFYLPMFAVLGLVVTFESVLLVLYYLVLRKFGVGWTLQLELRIVRGGA